MIFGEPMYVSEDATDEQVEEVRLALEADLHRLQELAEAAMGHSSLAKK